MNTVNAGTALPAPGELWQSGAPHFLNVRVLSVELTRTPPLVEYEVLDEAGSVLAGPLSVPLDSSWHAYFTRLAKAAAA
ncbi:MAG: hypothetical protein ACJ76Z_08085 [Thermoleophilaceae bacterium]